MVNHENTTAGIVNVVVHVGPRVVPGVKLVRSIKLVTAAHPNMNPCADTSRFTIESPL